MTRCHHNHCKTAVICAFLSPQTHPFLSALFFQWPSFCRHAWSGMAACVWWETVAHVAGLAAKIWHYWLKKNKRGEKGGGVYRKRPFSTLWDSGICSASDVHRFPSNFSCPPPHTHTHTPTPIYPSMQNIWRPSCIKIQSIDYQPALTFWIWIGVVEWKENGGVDATSTTQCPKEFVEPEGACLTTVTLWKRRLSKNAKTTGLSIRLYKIDHVGRNLRQFHMWDIYALITNKDLSWSSQIMAVFETQILGFLNK